MINIYELFTEKTKKSKQYLEKWRYNKNAFTRNRKMSANSLFLQIFSHKGKSLKNELLDLYEHNNDISVWGYEKKRLQINPLMFHEIAKDILIDLYVDEVKKNKFKDYLVLAIDGMDIDVPSTKENRDIFGFAPNVKLNCEKEKSPAKASISCIYDCLNEYILDTQINRYKYQERKSAMENIKNVQEIIGEKNNLITFDRGYFSWELLYRLKHTKFIFRITDVQLQFEKKNMDKEVIFNVRDRIKYNLYKFDGHEEISNYLLDPSTKFRILKYKLPTGQDEYLLTNIFDETFEYEDFYYLYGLRWNIENSYRDIKSKLKLEQFSGYRPDIVKQDIFVSIILYNNVTAHVAEVSNNEDTSEEKEYKYPTKINRNYATGILKTLIIKMFLEDDDIEKKKLYDFYSEKMKKTVIYIIKDRKYDRSKRIAINKCKMNAKTSY